MPPPAIPGQVGFGAEMTKKLLDYEAEKALGAAAEKQAFGRFVAAIQRKAIQNPHWIRTVIPQVRAILPRLGFGALERTAMLEVLDTAAMYLVGGATVALSVVAVAAVIIAVASIGWYLWNWKPEVKFEEPKMHSYVNDAARHHCVCHTKPAGMAFAPRPLEMIAFNPLPMQQGCSWPRCGGRGAKSGVG